MVAGLFGPTNLPTALDNLQKDIAVVREAVSSIAGVVASWPRDTPTPEARNVPLTSGGPAWQTPEHARIVKIVFSTDTAQRVVFNVENDSSRAWRIGANSPTDLGFSDSTPLLVPRGVRLFFTATNNWDAIVWWKSADNDTAWLKGA